MNQFFEMLTSFGAGHSVWVYAFIFLGKIAEVAVATLRIVLINRGERVKGSLIAVAEILLWLIVTGSVLTGYQEDFLKVVVFCVAFAAGNFLGSWLEERLAFGLCSVQAIVLTRDDSYAACKALRAQGFGVTALDVQGLESQHFMLITTIKRKAAQEAMELIQQAAPNAVITVSDVKTQKGGYLRSSTVRRARRLVK